MRRAIILAGGKGSRLRPYTIVLPKPLMPIGDFPILEVVVRQLIKNGFNHISMAVNHQASLIKTFFGNGEKWSINIDYFHQMIKQNYCSNGSQNILVKMDSEKAYKKQ